MSKVEYNKIIRNKVSDIIKANNGMPFIEKVDAYSDRANLLFKNKIKEEVAELLKAKARDEVIEEAADVIQVVRDYLLTFGIMNRDIEVVIDAKNITRGSFTKASWDNWDEDMDADRLLEPLHFLKEVETI